MTTNKTKDEIQEDDDEPLILTLEFDDGTSVEAEAMGIFEVDDQEYIALIPDDGSDDVFIYGYRELDDDDFELIDIEDEDEFNKVVEIFDNLLEAGEDGEE